MKDREAPELRLSENFWSLVLLLVVFNLQNKVVECNFSRNIMQTEYMAPNCRVSVTWVQSLPNVFLVNMIKNQFQGSS